MKNKELSDSTYKIGNKLIPYAYMSPALISILILTFIPVVYTIYISFTNYNIQHLTDYVYVGFENYKQIITGSLSHVFVPVFLWNVAFAVVSTLASVLTGLFLALLLNNRHMIETKIYRAILIIPWSLPGTIAILSWKGLLNESYGSINGLLNVFHIQSVPWLSEVFWARKYILMAGLWLSFPFMMNICLGVLQAIDPNLYEAADIDGATRWKKFVHITLPSIIYGILPLLITSFAGNFNNFGAAYLITAGNPARIDTQYAGYTDILMSAGYKLTTQNFRYDLASALCVLVFLIVGTLTFANMKMSHAFQEVD